MTEITRVPLQPVRKGSLTKLWLGVAAALAIAGGVAYASRYEGVEVEQVSAGTGASPTMEDVVLVNYVGKLTDGTEFDKGERVPMSLDQVVPGFAQGITKMQKGGKYRLTIPSEMAYGAEEKRDPQTGQVVIPASSDLVFDVELVDFKSRAEIMRQQQILQQLQQMQGGAGAGAMPGAMPGAPPPQ
jgi:FKBP-type peptidyl-prolyl cis-trans isomerase FkpA